VVHHRLEHLGGGDHGLAVAIGFADQALLDRRHLLERELYAQVAACDHHRVTRLEDPPQVLERSRFLDLRHQLHVGRDERAQLAQVLRPPHEGEAQIVDAGRRRVLRVLAILFRQGGGGHV